MAKKNGASVLTNLVKGRLNEDFEVPTRVVKIYICSSYTDFIVERQKLWQEVLPQLQHTYRQYGLEVEFVDPYQGALYDHVIDRHLFNIHLNEIKECGRLSEGPFFLCFVGNKYEPCCLPEFIEDSEFMHIKNEAFEAGKDVTILDEWYPLDENAVPPKHVLAPINGKFKYFYSRSSANASLCERDISGWYQTFIKLQDIVQYGSSLAFQEGLINQVHQHKQERFRWSGVDEQIHHAFKVKPKRCAFFLRNFENIDFSHPNAANYADVGLREQSKSLFNKQSHVRDKVRLKLSTENLNYYSIPWCETGVSIDTNPKHLDYMHQLVSDVVKSVGSLIELAFNRETPLPGLLADIKSRKMYSELLVQANHCAQLQKEKLLCFEALFDKVKKLLVTNSKGDHQAVLVHGHHGSGKSVFLAKAAKISVDLFGANAILITRSVGLTRDSETSEGILRSICWQLNKALCQKMVLRCCTLSALLSYFKALVNLASKMSREVVLVIDDIDFIQSQTVNDSPNRDWLFGKLLPKVHLIMSTTTPLDNETFTELINRFTNKDFVLELHPLTEAKVLELMTSILSKQGRTLTKSQQRYILQAAEQSTVPLWVNIVCSRVQSWTAMYPVRTPIPSSVRELLQSQLSLLDRKWGSQLLSTVLGYISLSSHGVTEPELLDLLSSNHEVLLAVYPTQVPTILRFPATLWLKIKHDLGLLLGEKFIDEHVVLVWRHWCFNDIVIERYFKSASSKLAFHQSIASLFMEAELSNNNSLIGQSECINLGHGRIVSQPLVLSTSVYNFRRMNELWIQLLKSGDISSFKEQCFCNFEYLLAKVHSSSVFDTIVHIEYVLGHHLDQDLVLVLESMRASEDILVEDPLQLACELIGRLRETKDYYSSQIESLVTQCMHWCDTYSFPLLVPLTSWLTPTMPGLVTSWTCTDVIGPVAVSRDNQTVFCVMKNHEIHMFNVPRKKLMKKFTGHTNLIHCILLTEDSSHLLSGAEDWTVRRFDLSTGINTETMRDHGDGVLCMVLTKDERLLITGSKDYSFKVTTVKSMTVRQTVTGHLGPVTGIALNSSDTILVTGSADGAIRLWYLEDMSPMNIIEDLPTPVICLAVSTDNIFLVAGCEDGCLMVKSLTTGSDVHQLQGHQGKIVEVAIATGSHHVVVSSDDGQVYLYNLRTCELLYVYSPNDRRLPARMAVSTNNEFVFCVSCNLISVWNVCKRYSNKMQDDGHTAAITSIVLSRDGKTAVSGSEDHLVKLWNLDTSNLLDNLMGNDAVVTCVGIAPDEAFVVSGLKTGNVKIWSIIMGTVVTNYLGHHSAISHVTVLSDSLRVVSAERDGVIHIWMADSGDLLLLCNGPTELIAVSGNDLWATSGAGDENLTIWRVDTGDAKQKLTHSDVITCAQFSTDSQYVITGSADMSLKVWETETGKLTQVLVEHENSISCVAITRDNQNIVSGSHDKNLIVWLLDTGAVLHKLTGHHRAVNVVQLTSDSSVAVSGSKDGSIRAWCMKTGTCLALFDMHRPVVHLKITATANHIVVLLEGCRYLPLLCLHNTPAMPVDRFHHASQTSVRVDDPVTTVTASCSVLPIRPKMAPPPQLTSTLPPPRLPSRQASLLTIADNTPIAITKAPLQTAVKAQEEKSRKKKARPKPSQTSDGSTSSSGTQNGIHRNKSNLCCVL